jgi:hypothetical protein
MCVYILYITFQPSGTFVPIRAKQAVRGPSRRKEFIMNLKEMLRTVQALAKKQGLTVEKYVEAVISFDEATATERSTKEERLATMERLCSASSV